MPASYGNITIDYSPPAAPPPPNATDLHIASDPAGNIDLLGVNGVGPDDPKAQYNAEGSGTGEINLSGLNVAGGGSVTVRIKSPSVKLPKLTAQWTVNNKLVLKPKSYSISMEEDEGDEPIYYVDALESILEVAAQAIATARTAADRSLEEDVAPARARRSRERAAARG